MDSADGQAATIPKVSPVVVDYFYEAGCPDCLRVRAQVLPQLAERFTGFYVLNDFDVGLKSNVIRLVAYQKALGITKNEPVSMIVDYRHVLNGFAAISTGLFARVDEGLAERQTADWHPLAAIAVPIEGGIVLDRMRGFTLAGVLAAGLVDSINPCAIASLVFFMSLLSVAHIGKGRMWLAGGAFIIACFATYLLLGFGLFRLLYLFSGLPLLRRIIDAAMLILLAAFAWLSFRDALRFRRSGDPADVTLQLPAGIKRRIRETMRRGLRTRSLLLGGLGIGVVVTALESVCTGQVYVPTLVFVVKSGQSVTRSLGYLLAYNAMFVLPLLVVLALTCQGLQTPKLVEWSRRNVVFSKVLLGLFFLGMAVLIVAL